MLMCTFTALALAAAPALGAAAVPATAPTLEAPPVAPLASFSAALPAVPADDGAWCIKAFSKDFCAEIFPGGVRYGECVGSEGQLCRSIWLQNFTWVGTTSTNNKNCSHGCGMLFCLAPCDEVRDGTLTLTLNAIIRDRGTACCNYFGCWSGTWEFVSHQGVFTGTATGTLGRGSNRGTVCDVDDVGVCETCHEAHYNNDGTWHIAFEGSFQGADDSGRALCFTADGDWVIPGSCQGGPDFANGDVYFGEAALEGARIDPCVQP